MTVKNVSYNVKDVHLRKIAVINACVVKEELCKHLNVVAKMDGLVLQIKLNVKNAYLNAELVTIKKNVLNVVPIDFCFHFVQTGKKETL